MLRAVSFATVSVLLSASLAHAAEWHFCLAAARSAHRVYLTEPFLSADRMPDLEARFAEAVEQLRLPFDAVQCPRAENEFDARTMREHAASYNVGMGTKPVPLDWSPESPVAHLTVTPR